MPLRQKLKDKKITFNNHDQSVQSLGSSVSKNSSEDTQRVLNNEIRIL
jgi:hypothetical protein